MPLILSNEDVMRVLTMGDCLEAMERAFRDLGEGEAVSRPRSELILPQAEPGRHYLLKSWDAALPSVGLAATRLTSNMMQRREDGAAQRLDPMPLAGGGGGYVGLILLFDIATLELVAIIQDARLQVMRAGATYGLAAKYLARKDAEILGLLGSGGQAREQLTAIAAVRRLKKVQVFSPTKANREAFAASMAERLGIEIIACESPQQAVRGADIVAAATSALEPVVPGEWLEPGQHVSFAGPGKGDRLAFERAALVVVQTRDQTLRWQPARSASQPPPSRRSARQEPPAPQALTLLGDIVAGRHQGRSDPQQITIFGGFDSFGPGTAYAAVGAVVLERARRAGLGHEVPAEWFIQAESS
jgi:ornithine cyclodeaminase/alanine dehydrogenase-like protein (mu-crystallin family)